ncbi:MAG: heparan-alpha-glucosaminide N-acetyltransferase domain-containing protein [Chitinophagaceae bacterium]
MGELSTNNALSVASKKRIQSLDVLRGIVMVIMALDHVRDFFYNVDATNAATVVTDPTNINTTTPALFFTRWITHFCAPVFVFLSGTSAWLMSRSKSKGELSRFLIQRGLWLVFIEVVVITFGWSFDPLYHLFFLQVIWAFGISMFVLGLLVYLPANLILCLGFIIVFGHNVLDYPVVERSIQTGFLSNLSYFAQFTVYDIVQGHSLMIIYAFLPWTGVMLLGYGFGKVYGPDFSAGRRKKLLVAIGSGLILIFLLLRFTNVYGDRVAWKIHPRGWMYTFLSFLNVNKYPPSLLYLCITLGPALIVLSLLENFGNRFTRLMRIYGRVPLFYYILHIYIIHMLVVIAFYASGYTSADIINPQSPFYFCPPDFGFSLPVVYMIWIFVVIVLYPLCKRYNEYKSTHHKWWLDYL